MEPTNAKDTTIWPPKCENKFVQMLVDMVNIGKIVNGSVPMNLWSPIASQLSNQIGRTYTAKQCKTKFFRLQMNHREFSDLLHHNSGLGWDPISNIVQGTKSQWQSYLRINKKAGCFRKKGCPNYKMLGLIFNGSIAIGVLRHSSSRTPPDSEEEEELNDPLLLECMSVLVLTWVMVSYLNRGVVIGGHHNGKCPIDYSGPSFDLKRKGKGKGNDSSPSMDSLRSDALKEFRDLDRLKKEMMLQDQAQMSSGEGIAGVCGSGATFQNSMSRALNILDELAPDLDNHMYLRAFELLQDETICDGFIAMPPFRRKAWLASL
ncbi:hypothetical protein SLA2020_282080 [Shorea laevis]